MIETNKKRKRKRKEEVNKYEKFNEFIIIQLNLFLSIFYIGCNQHKT